MFDILAKLFRLNRMEKAVNNLQNYIQILEEKLIDNELILKMLRFKCYLKQIETPSRVQLEIAKF